MEFFDFVNISERTIELINPLTPEKVVLTGKYLRLREGARVIDFGSGYAEPLVIWAENYGVSGIGIDIRQHVCDRALQKLKARGLQDRIKIVCGKGAEYTFEEGAFDAATCIGASFIWKGFEPTLKAMRSAIKPRGRIAIGEPYWVSPDVPAKVREAEPDFLTEPELLRIIRKEGFELEYVIRSSPDDWDTYEASNWHGLILWLEENPDHPERQEVIDYLHKNQDEYAGYLRQNLGWAVYVLAPSV